MGDTDKAADEKEPQSTDNAGDAQDDGKTEDDADTSKNTDADDADGGDDGGTAADDADGAKDGDDDDGKGDDKKSDTAAADTSEDDADDGSEPEMRRPKAGASNAEWAAYRKQQKGKEGTAKKSGESSSDKEDDAGGDADDDLSPEDAKAIDKRVEQHLAPVKQLLAEQEVEGEIAAFLATNPDFKPFAAKAKRWAMHPSRQNVPVKSIFYELAGDKLLQIGATRRAQADKKAKQTRTGGGSTAAADESSKSYKDMPLEEFGKELDKVKSGSR